MGLFVGNNEISKIYIGGTTSDYSAMRGPCSEGYHVPMISEWANLKSILTTTFGLASSGATAKTYLKMPFSGDRVYSSAQVSDQSSDGVYWSSTPAGTNNANIVYIDRGMFSLDNNTRVRSMGLSIRPFKDSPVVPDSSWTILYNGSSVATGAGVFHNSSLGLISISGDGITWITIADKNLGATTVYNDGNSLSQSNCGGYYQWGNNYMFPYTGSVSTSSSQVNAGTYGPSNYYSSSTFIIRTSSPYTWDSSNNANLRGRETGVKIDGTKVSSVYVGSTKVRPPFKPRTFTVTWTESSMMSGGGTYSDDAAGLTAGSTDFDEFFGYSAVRLNTSGQETASIAQSSPGVLDITQLGTLTSGDNVMIKFPVRGIKITKSGSNVTLSITNELNKTGYIYHAFARGATYSGYSVKPYLYLGAYKGSRVSGVLKSWSGQSVATSANTDGMSYFTSTTACTTAQANGAGYDNITYFARQYINCLYMMKYGGNPRWWSTVGSGYTGGSAVQNTGGTNSITNATGATSTGNTGRIKLFGLEDWWGNMLESLNGMACTSYSSSTWTVNLGLLPAVSSGKISSFEFTRYIGRVSYMKSIYGENIVPFLSANGGGEGSSSTYYCSYFSFSGSSSYACCAGSYYKSDSTGNTYSPFSVVQMNDTVYNSNRIGTRLMYLEQ